MTNVSKRHRRRRKPSKPGAISAMDKRLARDAAERVRTEKLREAGYNLAQAYAAGRDEAEIDEMFAREVGLAMLAAERAAAEHIRAARSGIKTAATREKLKRKTAAPMGGEGPSDDHLRKQEVVTPAVRDRKKPRHARLTGELPVAVQGMVRRGWLHVEEARALKMFADDFELGSAMGPSGPGPLRERVDGGKGPTGSTGRSGQSAAAWNRYLSAKQILGGRISGVVEAVMIQQISLADVDTPQKEKKRKVGGTSALLMAAGELLRRHYVDIGVFQ